MKKSYTPVEGPLRGLRILDFTRLYPGPLATMFLAGMGADVIKLENLAHPDPMRFYPPFIDGESAGYLAVNCSKRSLGLDFEAAQTPEVLKKLLQNTDILFESYRPETLKKCHLDYQSARDINPGIIYISLTGYGQNGPLSGKASHDLNYLALSGLLGLNRTSGETPILPGGQIGDITGGTYLSMTAALSALWQREKTGEGQFIDLAMLDGVLPLLTLQFAHFQATGQTPLEGFRILSGGMACYNVYRCSDDRFVAIAALEPKFWANFCTAVHKPEWIDLQFQPGKDQQRLKTEVQALFATQPRDYWESMAETTDICLTPVLSLAEVPQHPQVRARGVFSRLEEQKETDFQVLNQPIKFSPPVAAPARPASQPGADSAAILSELGYTREEIDRIIGHDGFSE